MLHGFQAISEKANGKGMEEISDKLNKSGLYPAPFSNPKTDKTETQCTLIKSRANYGVVYNR